MQVLQTIRALASFVWSLPGVQIITLLTLINAGLAVAVALKTQTFSFREFGTFATEQLLPYVITYGVFALAANGTQFEGVASIVLAGITAMQSSRIVDNLGKLGIPVPAVVLKYVAKAA